MSSKGNTNIKHNGRFSPRTRKKECSPMKLAIQLSQSKPHKQKASLGLGQNVGKQHEIMPIQLFEDPKQTRCSFKANKIIVQKKHYIQRKDKHRTRDNKVDEQEAQMEGGGNDWKQSHRSCGTRIPFFSEAPCADGTGSSAPSCRRPQAWPAQVSSRRAS